MHFVERLAVVGIAVAALGAERPLFVHGQRYAMGTMFDIAVYHPARAQAERAVEAALAESRGRVSGPTGAAARLGIPRSTLESKIRSLRHRAPC